LEEETPGGRLLPEEDFAINGVNELKRMADLSGWKFMSWSRANGVPPSSNVRPQPVNYRKVSGTSKSICCQAFQFPYSGFLRILAFLEHEFQ
jgi:hypothetical protein